MPWQAVPLEGALDKANGGPRARRAFSTKRNFVHSKVLVNGWSSISKRLSFDHPVHHYTFA